MKIIKFILLLITMATFANCTQQSTSKKPEIVRLSRIVVDPARLEEYKVFLKEEIEASMEKEPGVLTLYYISPQINRAEKNKSYFYNCYGKEEKFYIENQG